MPHIFGSTSGAPAPSTNDGAYSTGCGDPAANEAANGAPVSGSTVNTFVSGRSALTALAIPAVSPPPP